MVATALFSLVFALTEGATYGWLLPLRTFAIGPLSVWPKTMPIAAPAAAVVLALVALAGFVAVERRRTGARREPLVELDDLRARGFRFGLATAAAVVMAQAGVMFVLAVYLQTTHRLSAAATGGWLLPVGAAVLLGANVGGTIAARLGPTTVVRAGLVVELVGVVLAAATVGPDVAFAVLAPALGLFGIGAGLANSQLWNITLSDVPAERAGAASGVVTTNNSVAAALGVAAIGTMLRATESGTAAARWALIAAAVVVAVGTVAAAAIPRMAPTQRTSAGRASTPGQLLERHLSRAEWRRYLLTERDRHQVSERREFVGWVLDDASDVDRTAVMAELPRPARLIYRLAIRTSLPTPGSMAARMRTGGGPGNVMSLMHLCPSRPSLLRQRPTTTTRSIDR